MSRFFYSLFTSSSCSLILNTVLLKAKRGIRYLKLLVHLTKCSVKASRDQNVATLIEPSPQSHWVTTFATRETPPNWLICLCVFFVFCQERSWEQNETKNCSFFLLLLFILLPPASLLTLIPAIPATCDRADLPLFSGTFAGIPRWSSEVDLNAAHLWNSRD